MLLHTTKGKPRGATQQANAPSPCCARVFRAIVLHSSATTVCQPTAWQHQAASRQRTYIRMYVRTDGKSALNVHMFSFSSMIVVYSAVVVLLL